MANNTTVILASNIKMDRNYLNVLDYTQSELVDLLTKSGQVVNDCMIIRDEVEKIKVPVTYYTAFTRNYLAFKNSDLSNDWFFAWIDRVNYINENVVEIEFTIDIWSTFFSRAGKHACFVEREHANSDNIGENLISEHINISNYKQQPAVKHYFRNWCVCMQKVDTTSAAKSLHFTQQGELWSTAGVRVFDLSTNLATQINMLNTAIEDMQGDYGELVGFFMFPKEFIDLDYTSSTYYRTYQIKNITINMNVPRSIDGYVPKNKKLFTYPYCYLVVDTGEVKANFRFEFFDLTKQFCQFQLSGEYMSNPEVDVFAMDYKNQAINTNEMVPKKTFPQMAFAIDSYLSWKAQNSASLITKLGTGIAGSAITGGMGAALAGASMINPAVAVAGASIGAISAIASATTSAENASNSFTGSNTGDVLTAIGENAISFIHMQVEKNEAVYIDNYFSLYGYQTNKVKYPNISGRMYWNYIKINGVMFSGNFGNEFIDKLNKIVNDGVTIWHSHDKMLNYGDMSNPII